MVKTILLIIFFILAIWGLSETIYAIRLFWFYPGKYSKNYVFIVLKKDYAIKQLNFLWQKIKWHGDEYASGIIAITDFIDDIEIESCNDFITNKKIVLCNLNEITECHYIQGDF